MPETYVVTENDGCCGSYWSNTKRCTCKATWQLVDTKNQGYAYMCVEHKERFQMLQPDAPVSYLRMIKENIT